jgi:hypothetical protein
MTTEQLGYDKTNIASIFEYSQKLIGHSLRELVSEEEQQASNLQGQGKGGLGQMIEDLFFHYPINSDPVPDFREVGMDLKATGLKKLMSGELQIKDWLVSNIIDYEWNLSSSKTPFSTNALHTFQETLSPYTKNIQTNPLSRRTYPWPSRTLASVLYTICRPTSGHTGARCLRRGVILRASALS